MSTAHTPPFRYHPKLGYDVRSGSLKDQEASSYDLCIAAIQEQRWDDAAAHGAYTVYEATEPHELYRDWIPMVRTFIVENGGNESELKNAETKLLMQLRWPDGSAFDPEIGWNRVTDHISQCIEACKQHDAQAAASALENARAAWLETHDRKCDWLQGLIDIAAEQLGQQCVGRLWRELMAPMFESYDKYDIDTTEWPESADRLLFVTAEALRGHLSGPGRRGSIKFVEEPGRKGYRFTPCGSGGRNFDDDAIRTFGRTDDAYQWAWNMKGVCLYCAHCCALSHINPIERFGYPARVVEPPYKNETGERDHCTWWIYDDPHTVPDAVYRQTGHEKPAEIGGAATRRGREITE